MPILQCLFYKVLAPIITKGNTIFSFLANPATAFPKILLLFWPQFDFTWPLCLGQPPKLRFLINLAFLKVAAFSRLLFTCLYLYRVFVCVAAARVLA